MSEAAKWFAPNHQLTYFKLSEYEVSLFPVLSHNNNTDNITSAVLCSAPSVPQLVFTITEKAPTRAFSWLAPTRAFTFKTLLRHYAQQALTPRSLNVKLGL